MSKKYLDSNGLLCFWHKIKETFALKSDVPGPATDSPKMDGTVAIGSSAKYAKEDHVHPTDTSRVPTSRKVAGHALSSDVTISKGDVGLGNVDNTADASKSVASAGKLTTAANIDGVDFDGSADVVRYGVCSTAVGTAAKTVTLEGSTPFKLVTGASVFVKFSSTNTAAVASLTLNVNGTGAKAIKRYGTTSMASTGNLGAGMICQFVYDGTNWLWVGHVDTNTTYSNATLGQAYGTCEDSSAKTDKTVSAADYTLTKGGIIAIMFTMGCHNVTTLNVNNKGAKCVIKNNTQTSTTSTAVELHVPANHVGYFIYSGSYYVFLGASNMTSEYVDDKVESEINQYFNTHVVGLVTSVEDSADGSIRMGTSSGDYYSICPIDWETGLIDSSHLPSYVDDIIEAYARSGQEALSKNWLATGSASGTVIVPETGKIYVLMATSGDYAANTQFRWSGTAYVKLNDGGVSEITNSEIDTIMAS